VCREVLVSVSESMPRCYHGLLRGRAARMPSGKVWEVNVLAECVYTFHHPRTVPSCTLVALPSDWYEYA